MKKTISKGGISVVVSLLLALAVAVLIDMRGRRLVSKPESFQDTNQVAHVIAPPVAASAVSGRRTNAVIETGEARMSNAVRCMAFIVGLADNMPKEQKRDFYGLAGLLFFQDCLMAKMTNGYITTTTNELRAAFTNALAQVFSGQLPPDLADALNSPVHDDGQWRQSLRAIREGIKSELEHPDVALLNGFNNSFEFRDNAQKTVDQHYQELLDQPALARPFKILDRVFGEERVVDASQSDLREMCLDFGAERVSVYGICGPQSGGSRPDMFHSELQNLDKIFQWRLVNVFGLDDSVASELASKLSHFPVTGYSHSGLVVPASIQ